jgi:hypothetical protein
MSKNFCYIVDTCYLKKSSTVPLTSLVFLLVVLGVARKSPNREDVAVGCVGDAARAVENASDGLLVPIS